MLQEQVEQNFLDNLRVEPSLYMNGETLTRILVDYTEHAENFTIMRPVLNKVIRPDMTFVLWPEPDARAKLTSNSGPLIGEQSINSARHILPEMGEFHWRSEEDSNPRPLDS